MPRVELSLRALFSVVLDVSEDKMVGGAAPDPSDMSRW